MSLQNVTFIYAYPLDAELRRSFEERGQVYPSRVEIRDVMQRWKVIWEEQNAQHTILDKLAKLTERVPDRNLECFIFGRGLTPKSTPFMMPIWNREQKQWSDEKFIDLMIHELLHIFLVTDNEMYVETRSGKICSRRNRYSKSHIAVCNVAVHISRYVAKRSY